MDDWVAPWNLKKMESRDGRGRETLPCVRMACIISVSHSSTHSAGELNVQGLVEETVAHQRTDRDTAVDYFSNGVDCLFDAWETTHGYAGGEDGSEFDRCCGISDRACPLSFGKHGSPCVTMPRVPSAPINSLVRSYPADDLLSGSACDVS